MMGNEIFIGRKEEKQRKLFIYALIDPRDGRVRYVGRTVNSLVRRLREHLYQSKRDKFKHLPRVGWLSELALVGLKPTIQLLEICSIDNYQAAEKKWIAHYRAMHDDIVNANIGGNGTLGGHFVRWTPELDAMLGKTADSMLAKQMGITRKSVSYRREQLGIAASFDRTNNKKPPPMGGHNRIQFTDEVIAIFGTQPDYVIAEALGCCKTAIARRRRELGIASYAEQTGKTGLFTKGMPHPRWSRKNVRAEA